MITFCTTPTSFGEVFFFTEQHVFWLPAEGSPYLIDYSVHTYKEDVPSEKWSAVSSKHLTEWSEE